MTPSNGNDQKPHPSVVIGAETYTVKLTGLTGYLLDAWGIDMATLGDAMKQRTGKLRLCFQLFAAATAHNFLERGQAMRTPEEWALALPLNRQKEAFDTMAAVLFPKPQPVTTQPDPAPAAVLEMPMPDPNVQ